jgi:hypothetical protein
MMFVPIFQERSRIEFPLRARMVDDDRENTSMMILGVVAEIAM